MALLRIDYRGSFIRNLRRISAFLFLGFYIYLLYKGQWGFAFLLAFLWGSLFREAVALFSPALNVIVVSRPLIPYYRKIATSQGLLAEDFGTTIHPLGLY